MERRGDERRGLLPVNHSQGRGKERKRGKERGRGGRGLSALNHGKREGKGRNGGKEWEKGGGGREKSVEDYCR